MGSRIARSVRAAAPGVIAAACGVAACNLLVSTSGLSDGATDQPDATAPGATDASDAASDHSSVSDGGTDASVVRCDPHGRFGGPTLLTGASSADDDVRPRLSADELTIYFTRVPDGGAGHIFSAHRDAIGQPFGAAAAMPGVNSPVGDGDPSVSADGTVMFFDSSRDSDGGQDDIFVAGRSSPTDPFSNPMPVAILNTAYDDSHPFLRADGRELWFTSDRPGGAGARDLYRATRTPQGIELPTRVAELSSADEDSCPVLSADGLAIYFCSARPGGQGQRDVWTASRPDLVQAFGAAVVVPELSSPGDDNAGWLSPDDCRMYLSSTRLTGALRDIFVAERQPP